MKKEITLLELKYLAGWTVERHRPAKARVVFRRGKDMEHIEFEQMKPRSPYRAELKNVFYKELEGYGYNVEPIAHWKK